MRLKLKVCGLREAENIQQIAALQPDYQGFIYYEKSPRFVGKDFRLPPTSIKRVGVFVNESIENILKIVDQDQLDLVQLHGDEEPIEVKKLFGRGIQVMKVFSIDENFNFNVVKPFVPFAKMFLFDTRTIHYGGSGKTFNWALLNNYTDSVPFFLSGGLSIENIREVSNITNPALYGVDVNSGVEDAPGIKNIDKLKELIKILKTI